MNQVKTFLQKKDIVFSRKRYLIEALSAMTWGLFSSLIIGLIFKTAGEQLARLTGENAITAFLLEIGTVASAMMGPAIGVSVAWGLKGPPLVLFSSAVSGALGAQLGGPVGAFLAAVVGAEFGKAVSRETRVDIIVTPGVTMLAGAVGAVTVAPGISAFMQGLGAVIMRATELQPLLMGIVVSVLVGAMLTGPFSSAALAIMLGLSGLAGGAATAGCAAHMVGFAAISYRVNGVGGLLAQGLGTSKLQLPNVMKNPWIAVPSLVASAITGPAAALLGMQNVPEGAGMGTSGLVGQIGTITAMGLHGEVLLKILLLHVVLPALLALVVDFVLRRTGRICPDDYRLDIGGN